MNFIICKFGKLLFVFYILLVGMGLDGWNVFIVVEGLE